jgi:hypothetical protein
MLNFGDRMVRSNKTKIGDFCFDTDAPFSLAASKDNKKKILNNFSILLKHFPPARDSYRVWSLLV